MITDTTLDQRTLMLLWGRTQAAMDKLRNDVPDANFSVAEDMAIEDAIYKTAIAVAEGRY